MFEHKRPKEYLERHLEPAPDKKAVEQSVKRLEKPIETIQYSNEGEVRIEKGDIVFQFSYKKADKDGIPLQLYYEMPNEVLYWLTKFNITREDRIIYDLTAELPAKLKILFGPNITSAPGYPQGGFNSEEKYCFIGGSLAKPKTLLVLLHEIGHAKDYASKTEEEKIRIQALRRSFFGEKKHNAESLAEILRTERAANTYALQKLKPLLGTYFSKQDALTIIHGEGLGTHSKMIQKEISKLILSGEWDQPTDAQKPPAGGIRRNL